MLKAIGVSSLDELIERTVPGGIRLGQAPAARAAVDRTEQLAGMKAIGARNDVFRSYIGMGYYGTVMPAVVAWRPGEPRLVRPTPVSGGVGGVWRPCSASRPW